MLDGPLQELHDLQSKPRAAVTLSHNTKRVSLRTYLAICLQTRGIPGNSKKGAPCLHIHLHLSGGES